MAHDFTVLVKNGTITLPKQMLKDTNVKEADEIEISLISKNRFLLVRTASHRKQFVRGEQVTRQGVEQYLTKHGFYPSTGNADVWEAQIRRKTKVGEAIGKLYTITVNVPELIADPKAFGEFIRRRL